eukprot:1161336-Pelagomonas_calceolata.AAC.4
MSACGGARPAHATRAVKHVHQHMTLHMRLPELRMQPAQSRANTHDCTHGVTRAAHATRGVKHVHQHMTSHMRMPEL